MFSSATYDRINKTWFDSWTWNTSAYGERELRISESTFDVVIAEYNSKSDVKHGRAVTIYNYGRIIDGFYRENKAHGPQIDIFNDGIYMISMYEDDKEVEC